MNELNTLFQPVGEYCRREVITCSADDPLVEAAAIMRTHGISGLVVCRAGVPAGMLTDRDLRNKAVAEGRNPRTLTVGDIMSSPLITVGEDTFLFEALHRLSRSGIHRLVVVDAAGRLAGIITDSDILRLQNSTPQHLILDIEEADDVETLKTLFEQVQKLVVQLLGAGVAVQDLVRNIAHLNDRILVRLVDLLLVEEFSDLSGRFAFLVLGSEGRGEQTLSTDQDNALVYADDLTLQERQRMVEFSQALISGILAVGIPSCPGGIMANNPLWRHSLSEWRVVLDEWFGTPVADNLLRIGMVADMRALQGDLQLEKALKEHILGRLAGDEIFLGHMTAKMLRFRVPLGWFGRIKTEKGEHRGKLDLKKAGIFTITEGVKILALSEGVSETGTAERIERLVRHKVLSRREADDLEATFHALVYFRLRTQVEAIREKRLPDNRIALDLLNRMEKGRLQVALEGVRSFQGVMERRYPLGQMV
ncbi:signal transduction protein [Desulfuromonas soudanensis]|uniref:Signal transduction protein n=1 Tax=Desulfuromonas soudanensis TaxID=1603606 RepID=A0A0M4CY80_9BACT|nr:putative nucleotidyltransferase substrate binding domain-containing protein [Desulfuromonas soudanensis]ALC17366.1 signal transduction protein [Desulfuromonas soudanensis]